VTSELAGAFSLGKKSWYPKIIGAVGPIAGREVLEKNFLAPCWDSNLQTVQSLA